MKKRWGAGHLFVNTAAGTIVLILPGPFGRQGFYRGFAKMGNQNRIYDFYNLQCGFLI
jgi:hypothetical protein